MPLVTKNAEVALVTLVYREPRWLDFVMEGVARARTSVRYRWLVVANDPTPAVKADPRVDIVYTNTDPSEFYINRVYRAWNMGVLEAPTPLVVMLNNDMYPAHDWLDELVAEKKQNPRSVPTSLLVESGRVPSGMPEYVHDFGMTPDSFQAGAFQEYADQICRPGKVDGGRLYMPILVDRQEFFDVGAYPEGNPPGTTGDKDLIQRYAEAGFEHLTALGSVCYHSVMGEQNWPCATAKNPT